MDEYDLGFGNKMVSVSEFVEVRLGNKDVNQNTVHQQITASPNILSISKIKSKKPKENQILQQRKNKNTQAI